MEYRDKEIAELKQVLDDMRVTKDMCDFSCCDSCSETKLTRI